jgi:homoserine kinase type II
MSVYTKVSEAQASAWLRNFSIGPLLELQGIAAGIENTNYFVTTAQGRFVLTLFERLPAADLPFYLNLMAHLARHGIPCPAPVADKQDRILGELNGKPAALVTRLAGVAVTQPSIEQCAHVGAVLAEMHVAGASYAGKLKNPRGPSWWRATAPQVMPFLDEEGKNLLATEIRFQTQRHRSDLPRGAIHADLFRDNVLFDGSRVGGVIDFYFAGIDAWLFDVAVTLNDWCVHADSSIDRARAEALLQAYHAERPFTELEREAWPVMLRGAALRFWLSRLLDFHLPRPGELVHAHDPEHLRRILVARINASSDLPWV